MLIAGDDSLASAQGSREINAQGEKGIHKRRADDAGGFQGSSSRWGPGEQPRRADTKVSRGKHAPGPERRTRRARKRESMKRRPFRMVIYTPEKSRRAQRWGALYSTSTGNWRMNVIKSFEEEEKEITRLQRAREIDFSLLHLPCYRNFPVFFLFCYFFFLLFPLLFVRRVPIGPSACDLASLVREMHRACFPV